MVAMTVGVGRRLALPLHTTAVAVWPGVSLHATVQACVHEQMGVHSDTSSHSDY